METASDDESVRVGAWLWVVVIMGFEFDAVVGGFLSRREGLDSFHNVVDDFREILIDSLEVKVLLFDKVSRVRFRSGA